MKSLTLRQIRSFALFALLLCFLPNALQDFHRVFGHKHTEFHEIPADLSISNQEEKCLICVFEFNIPDAPSKKCISLKAYQPESFFFVQFDSQLTEFNFLYFNLRAPPTC